MSEKLTRHQILYKRPNTKLLYALKPDEDWLVYEGKIVITHPERKPKIVNPDGSTTEIELTWPKS